MREGWRETTLGEVADINPEPTPRWPNDHEIKYVDIASLAWGKALDASMIRPQPFGSAPGRARRLIRAGDVVVSTVRPNLKAMATVPPELDGEVASTGLAVLRARDDVSLPGYVWALVSHQDFSEDMVRKATGSNYPAVRPADVSSYPVLLPPLSEQRRIVDLIGAVDDAIEKAEGADEGLQSAMRHFPSAMHAQAVRDSWPRASLGEALGGLDSIRTGPFGSQLHQKDYVPNGPVAVVMPANMHMGRVNMQTAVRISQGDADRLARHQTQPGDILWSRRGDVTRFAVIDSDSAGSLCGTGCFLLRPRSPEDTAWLEPWLAARSIGDWLTSNSVGATMANLNRSILSKIPVALPPESTQHRWAQAWIALRGSERRAAKSLADLRTLRSNLLTALLSGEHEIPESYDELIQEAS